MGGILGGSSSLKEEMDALTKEIKRMKLRQIEKELKALKEG